MTTSPDYCPSLVETEQAVIGLLPSGPAWEAARIPGTVHNAFWSAVATTTNFIEGRLCAFWNELFCSTVTESFDQWSKEYDLVNDPCDPYGLSLCAKVNAQGGQTMAYFIELAASIGWVITLDDHVAAGWQDTLCVAGEAVCGLASLGPRSVPWALCGTVAPPSDTSGSFMRYTGYAHHMKVTINVAASSNALAHNLLFDNDPLSLSGGTIAGETYLNAFQLGQVLCFLERVKPAHVTLDYVLINN